METNDRRSGLLSRIVLGTAQLGMSYGIANRIGRPDDTEARRLIARCIENGITWFDTARAYGQSEAVLGRIFAELCIQAQVNVVGKGALASHANESLTGQIHNSLEILGIPGFAFWLAHDEKQLDFHKSDFIEELEQLRHAGLVGGFGISAYTPRVALRAVESHGLAAIQFPCSPFDRRFFRNDIHVRLADTGAFQFIRSIYLQGLCLMGPSDVPVGVPYGKKAVRLLNEFCHSHALPRDLFCLHYVLHRSAATEAKLVIGMESHEQLERNLELLTHTQVEPRLYEEWDALWPHDHEALILPYLWKTQS
jgi:aryl-alcohol dehydrogenase-like predicted oxidoreductase